MRYYKPSLKDDGRYLMICIDEQCKSKNIRRNGAMKLKSGQKVLRYRCTQCGKSFRRYSSYKKRELRGRKTMFETKKLTDFDNIFNYGFIKIVQKYQEFKSDSFYELATTLSGLKRTTLSRYLNDDTKNINSDVLVEVVVKIKNEILELDRDDRTFWFKRVVQECGEIAVKSNSIYHEKSTFNCPEYLDELAF